VKFSDRNDATLPARSASDPYLLDRRQFLISASVLAGGLALAISSGTATKSAAAKNAGATAQAIPWGPDSPSGNELSAWIVIAGDNSVTFRVPTPEIGNGAMTQVAMNLAEELACNWADVRVEFSSVHRDYIDKGVYTSGFLPFFGGHGTDEVRMTYALQLGASARERLKAAAAARWQVPVAEITTDNGVLRHKSGHELRYGDVAAAAASVKLEAEPALKPRSEWTFLGKASPPKLNIPDIVSGKAVFGIDVKVPGMVHAALRQSPVHGGTLKSHRPEAVLDMPGVRAVVVLDPANTKGLPAGVRSKATWPFGISQVQSAVAVIADHYWQAEQALQALPVEWDPGPGAQWKSSEQIYAAASALHRDDGGRVLRKSGDVASVQGAHSVEATYGTPYCENAALEPLNGTARVSDDGVEVWCPTQDMLQAFWVAADEVGVMPDKVNFHQTYVGGAFGRRTAADDVRMVVAVARAYPGVPVKTIWSREECFQQGRYRTPIFTRFKAELGTDGYPLAVESKVAFVGTVPMYQMTRGYDDMPYFTSGVIPNVLFSSAQLPVHVLNGAFRAPCYNSHAFFVETFIDECAVTAGIDPLEYRLKLLSNWDKPWSDCLRVAAKKIGWGRPLPKGEGIGIAITNWPLAMMHDAGTTICAAAHVKVSPQGELEVLQVDIAFDCGSVANPDAVRAQLEGGTVFGMNMTLYEEMTLKDGAMVERNFHQYPMLKMGDKQLTQVNVHFDALSGHERMDIIGEAPAGPVGPAIGNAIFQATGKRLRTTPFRNHDLSWT
jgi:isoquinoline 1-oxidoreductase beta subunit